MNRLNFTTAAANPVASNTHEFYTGQITKLYCTYVHLVERFSEIQDSPHFTDLWGPVSGMIRQVSLQADHLEMICSLLPGQNVSGCYEGLTAFLEEIFAPVYTQKADSPLRNVYVLSYLIYSHSIEAAVFQLLELIPAGVFDASVKELIDKASARARQGNPLLSLLSAGQRIQ